MINEKLGIPEGIVEQAKDLIETIKKSLTHINGKTEYTKKDSEIIIVNDNFDYIVEINPNLSTKINKLILKITNEDHITTVVGYTILNTSNISKTKNDNLIDKGDISDGYDFILRVNVSINESTDISEIIEISKKFLLKHMSLQDVSHELKHVYDISSNNRDNINLHNLIDYKTVNSLMGFMSRDLSEFLHHMYYFSDIENSVRSVEMYTNLLDNGITKSEFKDYIKDTEFYKKLRYVQNLDFDELIDKISKDEKLKEEVEEQVYSNPNFESNGSYKKDLIHLIYVNFYNRNSDILNGSMRSFMSSKLGTNNMMMHMIFGRGDNEDFHELVDITNKFARNNMKKLNKYSNNPREYFVDRIKSLKFNADKIKKKVHKIYDMIPNTKNTTSKSIKDWELHSKINKRKGMKLESKLRLYSFDSFLKNKKDSN